MWQELNRITGRIPYEELKDIKGETDRRGSARWWTNHCNRNDSFLMEVFCGQLKSHVTCLWCGYLSKAFDPFMDLSLPLSGDSIEDCLMRFMEPESLQVCRRDACASSFFFASFGAFAFFSFFLSISTSFFPTATLLLRLCLCLRQCL